MFYSRQPEYGSTTADDSFLEALAEGGFQVGALARLYYPEGVAVDTLDREQAIAQTTELLRRQNVVVFEAAIASGRLLARVDILVKRNNAVSLIEVKSKSFSSEQPSFFGSRLDDDGEPGLDPQWTPYIADLAFQLLALERAYPEFSVTPYLMLADKARRATVDGLHQKFLLNADDAGRPSVTLRGDLSAEGLGERILSLAPMRREIKRLERYVPAGQSFAERVDALAEADAAGRRIDPSLTAACRRCPYRIPHQLREEGKKSGFDECWSGVLNIAPEALAHRPLVLDMGRLDVPELLRRGIVFLQDLSREDLKPKPMAEPGLSFSQRRWLQVAKLKASDESPYLDREGLATQMASWAYPLHLIDFETMTAAVPFYRGARPYEQVAFQFSHHTMSAEGAIAHETEWIESAPGVFPNVSFARALRQALGTGGTILRYGAHENTVLCQILAQLESSEAPPADAAELIAWIRSLTCSPRQAVAPWRGERSTVDLCEMVKRFDFHPKTLGSNSLKYVLPAILEESAFLRKKYSQPLYGAAGGIRSHNFEDMAWVRLDEAGGVQDPYALLPALAGSGMSGAGPIFAGDDLRDGGAAMTAFARMQFSEMTARERSDLRAALLRYCELDTFAMALLCEYWRHELGQLP